MPSEDWSPNLAAKTHVVLLSAVCSILHDMSAVVSIVMKFPTLPPTCTTEANIFPSVLS